MSELITPSTWDASARALAGGVVMAIIGLELATLHYVRGKARRYQLPVPKNGVSARMDPSLALIPVLLLVNAFDLKGFFLLGQSPMRYSLLMLLIFLVVVSGLRSPPRHDQRLIGVALFFTLWVLGGAAAALVFIHPISSSLPMAASSLFVLFSLATRTDRRLDWSWFCNAVELVAYVYVLVHLASALGLIDTGINRSIGDTALYTNGAFTHEKSPILVLAVHCAFRRRSWQFQALLAACIAVIYFSYPAGTYPLVALAYLATLVVLARRTPRLDYVVAGILVASAYVVVEVTTSRGILGSSYYAAVGRTSNVSTRSVLWETAIGEIRDSPIFGSGFAGAATVRVSQGNLAPDVPPHNDYLQLLLLGGGLGLILFVILIFVFVRRLQESITSTVSNTSRRLAHELCFVAIASYLVVFAFNPGLLKLSVGGLFFAFVGLIPVLARQPNDGDGIPDCIAAQEAGAVS